MQEPLPYQGPDLTQQQGKDLSHLQTLAVCHYVWGGLMLLLSCVFLFHIGFGVLVLRDPSSFGRSPPPPFVGWLMIAAGIAALLLSWTLAVLTIYSARCLRARRRRQLSVVVAALNCLWMPVGTVLGVFTLIVLSRPSVQGLYATPPSQPTPG
jgi:hypothetical protein